MAQKYRKIKRQKLKYGRRNKRKGILKTVLFIFLILALVFLAYSVAGPIKKLINGELSASSAQNSSSPEISSSVGSSSEQTSSAMSLQESNARTITMPREIVLDSSKWGAFLNQAKQNGYNAVLAELKDEEGIVYFRSDAVSTVCGKAIAPNAILAEELSQKIKAADMMPIAAVNTFKDKTAPDKTKENTFMIKGSTSTWWDNSADKGGKPWLNPYTEAARNYNVTVVEEVAKAGFSEIVLRTVQLPEVRGMSQANVDIVPTSIANILSQYITEAAAAAQQFQAKVSVSYGAADYWTERRIPLGNTAASIKSKRISPVIRISSYGSQLTLGETVIEQPSRNIAATVKAVVTYIKTQTSVENSEIIPIIAAGQDIAAIVKALNEEGVKSYIIE